VWQIAHDTPICERIKERQWGWILDVVVHLGLGQLLTNSPSAPPQK
jgi:hypothetical protein